MDFYCGRRMSEMEARIRGSLLSASGCASLYQMRQEPACDRHQNGSIAVVTAVVIVGLIGVCALALDLSLIYNRKVELRNVADAAALGAAKRLNGTAGGINAAVAAAASAVAGLKYQYDSTTFSWSDSAIKFSTSPDRQGNWVDAGTAAGTPARIYYVKVDTNQLPDAGEVRTLLMGVVSSAFATVNVIGEAIAGRTTIDVAPLAICAMSTTPASSRTNAATYVELVEYGFRRGVSYDLMNLSPGGTTPVAPANFIVNPLAHPGTEGLAADVQPTQVGPYVCTGTLGIARITGDTIAVARSFPLAALYKQLNSRFDQYEDDLCNFHAAPPDVNIKSYVSSSIGWMNIPPETGRQTAACNGGAAGALCDSTATKLQTIADAPPAGGTAAKYGPVWAYAKAVPFSAYSSGVPEPSPNGYTTFTTAYWSNLYGGQTAKASYPAGSSTPYKAGSGVNFAPPSTVHKPGAKGRRVLNVPLLNCSAMPNNSATVLAIGRFFMTVPATAASVAAEFAGAVPVNSVGGKVELFP
ncbi:MAG: Pilus assembly protein TadE [Massilia sp.]|nr:Pilus assembly protein TadE [Massilia sp.]